MGKPSKRRTHPSTDAYVTFPKVQFERLEASWAEGNQNQKAVINRLLGIIKEARETASAQADSPEVRLKKIQEILK